MLVRWKHYLRESFVVDEQVDSIQSDMIISYTQCFHIDYRMVEDIDQLRCNRVSKCKYFNIGVIFVLSCDSVSQVESHQIWYSCKWIFYYLYSSFGDSMEFDEGVCDMSGFYLLFTGQIDIEENIENYLSLVVGCTVSYCYRMISVWYLIYVIAVEVINALYFCLEVYF